MPLLFRVGINVQEISPLLERHRKLSFWIELVYEWMCMLLNFAEGWGVNCCIPSFCWSWAESPWCAYFMPRAPFLEAGVDLSIWMETLSMLPLSPDPAPFPPSLFLREHVISSVFIHYWCCRNPNRLPFIVFSPQTEQGRAWSQQDFIRRPAIAPGASPDGVSFVSRTVWPLAPLACVFWPQWLWM